jgi:putative aldouronate transport system permease protein
MSNASNELSTASGRAPGVRAAGGSRLTASYVVKCIRRDKYLYMLFAAPLAYYLIFHYAPMYGLLIAFKDFRFADGIWGSEWVGLEYFRQFFADPYFYRLLRNVLLLNFFQLLFAFPAPIILALQLNEVRNDKFKRTIQTISYLPYFISMVVVAGLVVNFMAHQGIINDVIAGFGGERVHFLMRPEWYRFIHVGSDIWQNVGFGSIIYLAALTNIDPQLYEAATIDGANRWKKMLHVTLPGIAPTITIMMILQIGNFMTTGFEKILLLYNGSTYETADVIQTYVFRRGLLGADYSYATAVGLFQSVAALVFIVTANRVAKRLGETSLW